MRACILNQIRLLGIVAFLAAGWQACAAEEPFKLSLRYQVETAEGSGRFHRLSRTEAWDPAKTAIIVCDMWDSHHCYRAVLREKEFAPQLNAMLIEARRLGAKIIHAPSGCMQAYAAHPARQRAIETPAAANLPKDISQWCYQIPSEEQAKYPIDQSDGGEDDTPAEHAAWEEELIAQGRNPKAPWLRQIDVLEIDGEKDYISDSGSEIWGILEHHDIDHVMLAGVHTNMCVLGRPFGLRRLSEAGKNVVLVRDLTDTMYNPAAWPYVSHFSGTDLIVAHIERYVCPTITSDQILGGISFRFSADQRPHVAIIINEPEYETERTLPLYVTEHLMRDHRVSMVFGEERDSNQFLGIDLIAEADVLLLSVRRRTPPAEQLQVVRQFVAAGKPVLGIRTANHAFCLRNGEAPNGMADWPEFDAEVFGGSYTNHYGNEMTATVSVNAAEAKHPVLSGIAALPFVAGGSLYKVAPVSESSQVLLTGTVEGHAAEPVAWVYERPDGGKSFYTSLGSPADFDNVVFKKLLYNAIQWAAGN